MVKILVGVFEADRYNRMSTEVEYKSETSKIAVGDVFRYIIFFLFSMALFYISFRMVFPTINNRQLPLKNGAALGAVLLFCLVLWAIQKLLGVLSDKEKALCSILMFIAFVMLEIVCARVFEVKPSWDFGEVINGAKQIAVEQPLSNRLYFELYPHNLNPSVIIGTYLKIVKEADKSLYLLNIAAISLSVCGALLIAKKVFGINTATMVMLLCLVSTPLYLYVPIVYTDTLSLPFPVLALYFWIKWRETDENSLGKQAFYFALIGIFSAIGYLIKPIAAIVLVAVVIELFISSIKRASSNSSRRKGVLSITSAILAFILVLMMFNAYVDLKGYRKNMSRENSLPYTHWLMMGMNRPIEEGGSSYGYGGFSNEDLTYSRSFKTKKERTIANLNRMEQRLKAFGTTGYATFLIKKLEWTWTDGTYFAPVKLAREPVNRGAYHQFILYSDKNTNVPYLIQCQILHAATLFLILSGTVNAMRTRNMAGLRSIMVLSCFGIMLFLLAWESRSRYLTFFIPVFNIMAASSLEEVSKALQRHKAKPGLY